MLRRIGLAAFAFSASALAQTPVPPGMGPGNGGSQNNSNSSGGASGSIGRLMRAASATGDSMRENSTTGDISGRVVLSGGEPSSDILVQRVCGSTVVAETGTDSGGRFLLPRISRNELNANSPGSSSATPWGCELRASSPGYHTGALPLGNGRSNDGGEVVIVLQPASVLGMTISATTLLAPKKARESYDKGLDALRHSQPDLAQKHFAEAVRIYPRYAAAWLELGKVYEQRGHSSQARDAYAHAIGADGEYLFPYARLYRMDVQESRWKEAAAASGKVLRLNPYEFPDAYYFNALSNLELNQLDAAERSAREAAKLEGAQAEPRANYVLGVILWRKGDLDQAEEKLQTFLDSSTRGQEQINARRTLADLQKQKQRLARQAAEEASQTQISSPPDAGPGR